MNININNKKIINKSMFLEENEIKIEIGIIAKQATSSVVIEMDDTKLLISIVCQKNNEYKNFLQLKVDYQERS